MSTEENSNASATNENVANEEERTQTKPRAENTDKETAKETDKGAVLLERIEATAILTLARPTALNAISWAMYQQLESHLENLAQDEGVRVVIVRGEGGRAFAAGTDIEQFVGFTGEEGVAYEQKMMTVIGKLHDFPKPTIAAVQGYAVGAGIVLSSVCDLRYATPNSRFGVPIGRTLGNCLHVNTYRVLMNTFGAMRAKEMLLTGRLLSAADALQCGFLTAILDEDQLLPHVKEIAHQMSLLAPLTIWATKEAHRRISEAQPVIPFDDVITRVYGSEDFAEGVKAYLEKRKPVWKGN